MKQLYKSFRAAIRRQSFIQESDSILVGVSGGVDSMVLASLLARLKKDLNFEFSLAHVNYGLRGEESESQEKLVRHFADKNQIPCFVSKAELPKSQNLQAAARDFRYHFFSEMALQMGASKIAVAHHLEDQVETILAHWLRGSSLKGLMGMKPFREMGNGLMLIRPLLEFSKEELRAYAIRNRIPYIEDSSNESDQYWRNRLRHELLPVIQNLRPKAFQKIIRLGEEIRELNDYLSMESHRWLQEFGKVGEKSFWMPRPRFAKLPKTLRLEVLRQAVIFWRGSGRNLKRDHLTQCEKLSLGKKQDGFYPLPQGLKFVRFGDDLFLEGVREE